MHDTPRVKLSDVPTRPRRRRRKKTLRRTAAATVTAVTVVAIEIITAVAPMVVVNVEVGTHAVPDTLAKRIGSR